MSPISSRKSVRLLEEPLLLAVGAGERPLLVAEELRFEQRLGDRGAVLGDERLLAPPAEPVDRARDHLLAGAALAQDENRIVGLDHHVEEAQEVEHRRRAADDLGVVVADRHLVLHLDQRVADRLQLGVLHVDLAAQLAVRRLELGARRLGLRVQARVLDRDRRLVGEELHQLAVLLAELPLLEAVVEVEAADHAAARAQREREDRDEAHLADRRGGAERRVLERALDQLRGAALHHLLHDRAAHFRGGVAHLLVVEVARGGHLGVGVALAHQQEGALGAGELDGGVEDLRVEPPRIELACERAVDLEQAAQLGALRVAAAAEVEKRGQSAAPFVVHGHARASPPPEPMIPSRRPGTAFG
jgi:hypothetical protein